MPRRMSLQTQAVLRALLDAPHVQLYGLEISKAAGLPSGSLYPILARLEREGLIASQWEDLNPHEAGRPRRRYYWLTPAGAMAGEQAVADTVRLLSPSPASPARPSTSVPVPGWAGAK